VVVRGGPKLSAHTGTRLNTDSPPRRSVKVAVAPAMLAVGAAAAANTAFLPWLPDLVDQELGGRGAINHAMHVAVLSAIFPLGGMIAAPFAGALADRYRFQLFLFFAVMALAVSTALTGATSLVVLYGLRAVAGLAFGAIVPLCLLVGHQVACDPHEKAGLFTILTASLFLGDFAGPLLAEGSARILPELPLLAFGIGMGLVGSVVMVGSSESHYCRVPHDDLPTNDNSTLLVLLLLGLTITGTGGLAAIHLSLVLHRPDALFQREHIAWMLSLCGLAMLGAQGFHARFNWLVDRPVALAAVMLIVQGVALWQFSAARTGPAIAATIFAAGWSAATLRLIASFWISTSRSRSGFRLGLQHGFASISQVGVPIATAFLRSEWHKTVLWSIIAVCTVLLFALPLVWRKDTSTG